MTLEPRDLDEIVTGAHAVADQAGALLLEGLHGPKTIDHKGDVDLVTDYDRRAQDLIARGLAPASERDDIYRFWELYSAGRLPEREFLQFQLRHICQITEPETLGLTLGTYRGCEQQYDHKQR